MFALLRRAFGCSHPNSVREHRGDGWYWVCPDCGRAKLLNPRERDIPKAVGSYDEGKAVAGKVRADKAAALRQSAAARLSDPANWRKPGDKNGVVPMRRLN